MHLVDIRNLPTANRILLVVAFLLPPGIAKAEFSGLRQLYQFTTGTRLSVLTFAPGDDQRLFAGTQDGTIYVIDADTGVLNPTPFLSIPNVDTEIEGGLHSLAFHPDYQNNGKFYVGVTIDNGDIPIEPIEEGVTSPFTSHIREYTVSNDPNVANTGFGKIMQWVQPGPQHNDAWMGFGPSDGYLYVMSGDGGVPGDMGPGHTEGTGNSQDITDNPFGKIRRIDVDGVDAYPADPNRNYGIPADNPFVGEIGDDEIWAYGVRNPWKASFDRTSGDLWFGDVGAATREEIDFQPANSTGGENYGWRLREGSEATPGGSGIGGPRPPGNVDPVYDYLHDGLDPDPNFTGRAVTGGYVYRGPDPEEYGNYVFGDVATNPAAKYWKFDTADPYGTVENITAILQPDVGSSRGPVAFAEDSDGNQFVATFFGQVFALTTDAVVPGDFNGDGKIDQDDLPLWESGYGIQSDATHLDGDADGDGDVDGNDFLIWQQQLAGATQLAAATQVPEPTTLVMALVVLTVIRGRSRYA